LVMTHLPSSAPFAEYQRQADALLAGWQAGEELAVRVFRGRHPKFLDDKIPWLERRMTDADARAIPIDRDDARLALARAYEYLDWPNLRAHVEAMQQPGPVRRFEQAVEAVIGGDVGTLRALLAEDPDLVRARSTRACCFDPPVHRATLLHYLAANGVEGYHQKSPPNAVEVAKLLLDAGADPNALQDSYGGQNTTMSMLVSSTPPKEAGVQVPLVEILIDRGATIAPSGAGAWTSPLETALVFGMRDAARTLVKRGAVIETLAAAAGLGRLDDVKRLLPGADPLDRHRALALAAQSGHADVVGVLIDAGEDPNRFNPPGTHSHAQPLHQAVAAGHLEVVKLLLARGAQLDARDTTFKATPLGWADYCGQPEIASYLRAQGAST
jgi:hypothetical protein